MMIPECEKCGKKMCSCGRDMMEAMRMLLAEHRRTVKGIPKSYMPAKRNLLKVESYTKFFKGIEKLVKEMEDEGSDQA